MTVIKTVLPDRARPVTPKANRQCAQKTSQRSVSPTLCNAVQQPVGQSSSVPLQSPSPWSLATLAYGVDRAACQCHCGTNVADRCGPHAGRDKARAMPRYALKVEYHGGPFAGWQRQADQPSVQGAIEGRALAKLEPRAHTIAAAGRTDAGVHALAQVAHCDMDKDWDAFPPVRSALNHHLKPYPIAILDCAPVGPGIGTRGSRPIERRYLFRLADAACTCDASATGWSGV